MTDASHMRRALIFTLCAASILTVFNILKPIHLDDVIWWYFADHITRDPLHPFSFTITWAQVCQPAMHVMAPPILPYGWAAAIAVFGLDPALWKLALFPLISLLTWSLFDLSRRFVPQLALPVAAAMALSPTVIPAQNLMQDIPAIAFLLASLAVLLRACAKTSLRGALLAGVFLGFACLTKWSTLHGFGILGLACLLFAPSFWRYALASCGMAAVMFVGWELVLIAQEGQSHFLFHLGLQTSTSIDKMISLTIGLVLSSGGLAPFVALIGLAAISARLARVLAGGVVYLTGYVLLAALPAQSTLLQAQSNWIPQPNSIIYLTFSLMMATGPVFALAQTARQGLRHSKHWFAKNRMVLFLLGWVALELAGYFIFSPCPAARRLISLLIAVTLFCATVLHHRIALKAAWVAAGVQVSFGIFYALVDITDARHLREAVTWSQDIVKQNTAPSQDTSITWFSGEFGFDFYGIQAGFQHICGNTMQPQDMYARFDLYGSTPDAIYITRLVSEGYMRVAAQKEVKFGLPLTLMSPDGYYLGVRPMGKDIVPFGTVTIFEILRPFKYER